MAIYYFDALAGAGKTHALVRHADWLARSGRKVLFVQPTKFLIDKTVEEEVLPLAPDYPVKAIHGDTDLTSKSVVTEIVGHFEVTGVGGELLFVTQAAFFRIPYIQRKMEWSVIIDEIPSVEVFTDQHLPDTYHLLAPHLNITPTGAIYGRLGDAE